jgi:hypothetical protein
MNDMIVLTYRKNYKCFIKNNLMIHVFLINEDLLSLIECDLK